MVHASRGRLDAGVRRTCCPRSAIVVPAGRGASSGRTHTAAGTEFEQRLRHDPRPHRRASCPGFEDFNDAGARARAASPCRTRPRDARRFPTADRQGAASPSTPSSAAACPPGRLLLQTLRSPRPVQHHDLRPRRPLPRHQAAAAGWCSSTPRTCDDARPRRRRRRRPVSEWDGRHRSGAPTGFRVVAYPTARGCAAAYFPETNVLVPLDSTATVSGTPTSKSIVVRLEKVDT